MSDPRQDAELVIGDATYIIRFTNSALAHVEKLSGQTVTQFALQVMGGNVGFDMLTNLTFAGLEGARRKLRMGGKPWTKEQVADLLDDADNFDAVADPVIDALSAALERWFPPEQESGEGPPTAAGDGTTNSEPPSESG